MGDTIVTPPADQTVTPPVPPADPAEETRRENERLKKQLADKDKFITDLQGEKSTLEARLTTVQPKPGENLDADLQKEAAEILETAQVDPTKAGEKLATLIKTTTNKAQQELLRDLQPRIEQNAYVEKIKGENQDLMELGLEPSISNRAYVLMQGGKDFKSAVDTAVKEARSKVDKLKSNTPAPITPPPPGAVGEGGNNRITPPTPPPAEKTDEDELRAERERKRKSGL